MKGIEQQVSLFIENNGLLHASDKVLVAFSGGADSVFLLYFLNRFAERFTISLAAIHINHHIRDNEADADEQFCREFCREREIPFFAVSHIVPEYAREQKLSLEQAGRELRYREYLSYAEKYGYTKIATGHHLDDVVETILMNIIKGTGLRGLKGIPAMRGSIIRPLLATKKSDILHYLNERQIPYRTDASNFENDFQRNYIRNTLIPAIEEKLNPSVDRALLHLAEISGSLDDYLHTEFDDAAAKNIRFSEKNITFLLSLFHEMPLAAAGEFIRVAIEKQFGLLPDFPTIKTLFSLARKQTGTTEELQGGLKAVKERDSIVLYFGEVQSDMKTVPLNIGETVELAGRRITVRKAAPDEVSTTGDTGAEFIDAEGLSGKFELRKWQEGDAFTPLGMKGSKKVSDFLTDQKISAVQKKNQLVLLNNNRIIWVVGLRIDDRVKITKSSKQFIQLKLA